MRYSVVFCLGLAAGCANVAGAGGSGAPKTEAIPGRAEKIYFHGTHALETDTFMHQIHLGSPGPEEMHALDFVYRFDPVDVEIHFIQDSVLSGNGAPTFDVYEEPEEFPASCGPENPCVDVRNLGERLLDSSASSPNEGAFQLLDANSYTDDEGNRVRRSMTRYRIYFRYALGTRTATLETRCIRHCSDEK